MEKQEAVEEPNDEVLDIVTLPLAIDRRYNLIICTDCYIALPSDFIYGHVKDNHGMKLQKDELFTYFNVEEETLLNSNQVNDWLNDHLSIVDAVEWIPVYDGFKCGACPYSSRNKRTMRNHISINHREAEDKVVIESCKIQRIFQGWFKQYTMIEEMENDGNGKEPDWRKELEDSFFSSLNLNDGIEPNNGTLDLKLISTFIAKLRYSHIRII
jgi:hypothetical protein